MTDPDEIKLLFVPYKRRRLRPGERAHRLYRDKPDPAVIVTVPRQPVGQTTPRRGGAP
jgi:hypothetical protein